MGKNERLLRGPPPDFRLFRPDVFLVRTEMHETPSRNFPENDRRQRHHPLRIFIYRRWHTASRNGKVVRIRNLACRKRQRLASRCRPMPETTLISALVVPSHRICRKQKIYANHLYIQDFFTNIACLNRMR